MERRFYGYMEEPKYQTLYGNKDGSLTTIELNPTVIVFRNMQQTEKLHRNKAVYVPLFV